MASRLAPGEWLDWLRLMRRPCVRQFAAYDCGAAALATVARHHGYHISLESAREVVTTDRNGTTIWYIKDGAEALGFVARPARAIYDALRQLPMPVICHYEGGVGHWVAVYAAGERYVILADPSFGMRRLRRAEFERLWSGYCIDIRPGPVFQARKDEAPPWRVFFRMVLAERRTLAATLGATLAVGVLGWATAAFLQVVLDRVVPGRQPGLLLPLGVGLILLSALQTLLQIGRTYWEAGVGHRIQVAYINRYLDHLLTLPAQVLEVRCKGVLFQRVMDSRELRRAVGQGVVAVSGDLVMLLLALTALTLYAPAIALLACLSIPLMLLTIGLFNLPLKVRRDQQMYGWGEFSGHFMDRLDLVRPMKVFQAEERMAAALKREFGENAGVGTELQVLTAVPAALTTLINALTTAAVLWYGAARVLDGGLSPGRLVFLFGVLAFILAPVQRIPLMLGVMQDAFVVIERVEGVLGLKPERALGGGLQLPRLEGRISLKGVTFGYGPRRPVLRSIDVEIEPGQRVAIVGETGSGKTTLAAILAGLYAPDQGEVAFDGHPLAELDRGALRRHISAVFQKPCLVEGSVAENITLGAPVDQADVERAAALALADGFIAKLPRGYESALLSGGTNLSGGQAQRLAIARALLRDAPIMILDEATSSLDSGTEYQVWSNIHRVRQGKTTIVIAHRLSTIMDADKIVVLEGGRIAEEGSHRELMARGGAYYRIFRWQARAVEPTAAAGI